MRPKASGIDDLPPGMSPEPVDAVVLDGDKKREIAPSYPHRESASVASSWWNLGGPSVSAVGLGAPRWIAVAAFSILHSNGLC